MPRSDWMTVAASLVFVAVVICLFLATAVWMLAAMAAIGVVGTGWEAAKLVADRRSTAWVRARLHRWLDRA